MRAKGHAISTTGLSRIETGDRGLSLDEAFAFVEALQAVPLYMLTPPNDKLIRLSGSVAADGAGLHDWLVSGLAGRTRSGWRQGPPVELADHVERERERIENLVRLARLAQGFVDALNLEGEDDREVAATRAAGALRAEVLRQDPKPLGFYVTNLTR